MASNYDLTQLRDGMLATASEFECTNMALANAYLDCAHRVAALLPNVPEQPLPEDAQDLLAIEKARTGEFVDWKPLKKQQELESEPVPMVTVAVENKPRKRK
jgi:hypothetical protein